MNDEWKDFIVVVSLFLMISTIVIGVMLGISRYTCHYQYRDFSPSWGPITGCMVVYEGKNVPSDSLRVMD